MLDSQPLKRRGDGCDRTNHESARARARGSGGGCVGDRGGRESGRIGASGPGVGLRILGIPGAPSTQTIDVEGVARQYRRAMPRRAGRVCGRSSSTSMACPGGGPTRPQAAYSELEEKGPAHVVLS